MTTRRTALASVESERPSDEYPGSPVLLTTGLSLGYRQASTDLTGLDTDAIVAINTTSGSKTYTLPTSQSYWAARTVEVIKIDATDNTLTVTAGGTDTINGAASIVLRGNRARAQFVWSPNSLVWVARTVPLWADLTGRVVPAGGTPSLDADFVLSAGWGSTATVAAASNNSRDQAGSLTITASGTGQAAFPTVTHTFRDGAWTPRSPKLYLSVGARGGAGADAAWAQKTINATNQVWEYQGTPVAAQVYHVNYFYWVAG